MTTEPLELEGIYLGPFEIRLDWRRDENGLPRDRQGSSSARVARKRHPSARDGRHPVRRGRSTRHPPGLAQGRLLDFFTLVAGILRNYNPESPFVELALWYGQTCSDCGAVVSDDDCFICQKCGSARVRRVRSVVLRLRRLLLLGMHHDLRGVRRQLLPALPAALQAMPRRRLLRLSR